MNADNLINIHWMKRETLDGFLFLGLLYTQTSVDGLFLKIPYSTTMLNSAISFKNVWIDKNETQI